MPETTNKEKTKTNLVKEIDFLQKKFLRGLEILTSPLNTSVGTTPSELVYQEDKMKIFRYVPVKKEVNSPPVLMVYALINRQYMLDLQPDRSIIRYLVNQGIDVYIIDWGYPSQMDKFITLEDYIEGYLNNAVEEVLKQSGVSKLTMAGICQGGTFSAIYSALHPDKIKNLITIVSPIDFETDTGLLNIWSKGLDVDKMVDSFGNIPGEFMNIGFLLMNPFRLMLDKYVGFLINIDDKDFVNNFIRMEKWIFDSPDQAATAWKEFLRDCYQKNLLVKNQLKIGDKVVNLKNITMPVLNIFAEYDHLVPPACSRNFTDYISSKDKEIASFLTGHIGIFVSSRSQKEICPKLSQWIIKRSQEK
ncbi:MAG: class III poly(R)-hydroxyalkanoic acid synthase subunit PhaC [Planctomycetota bacterium]|nr:class III poly(R)-hydroxyalkanoic acid synthase subunit PhaC [Planctomycetota bacterium]MDI6787434.1 class III poly(R)-hydroxyalkanoic acid synthase subunit PhaC [Planctomycetota bacterium]